MWEDHKTHCYVLKMEAMDLKARLFAEWKRKTGSFRLQNRRREYRLDISGETICGWARRPHPAYQSGPRVTLKRRLHWPSSRRTSGQTSVDGEFLFLPDALLTKGFSEIKEHLTQYSHHRRSRAAARNGRREKQEEVEQTNTGRMDGWTHAAAAETQHSRSAAHVLLDPNVRVSAANKAPRSNTFSHTQQEASDPPRPVLQPQSNQQHDGTDGRMMDGWMDDG